MLPINNNFPTVEYTLLEDNTKENSQQVHSGETPLLDPPAPFSAGDCTPLLRPGWLGWVEWFKGCLAWSRRAKTQMDDEELQALLLEGRKLRQEAEAIRAQRENWYEFQEQGGCRPGWKTVAGAVLVAAAAVLGYKRYTAGWWSTGNPDGGLQSHDLKDHYSLPERLPPSPEAAALSFNPRDMEAVEALKAKLETLAGYQYSEIQPVQCKTEKFLNDCKVAHSSAKKLMFRIIMKVGQIPCLCPPPASSTLKILPPIVNKTTIEYQYTENQPDACRTENFLFQCDNAFFKADKLFVKMELKAISGEACLCPPPIPPFSVTFKVIPPIGGWPLGSVPTSTAAATVSAEAGAQKKLAEKSSTINEVTTAATIDYVQIERMFNLSCIEEREDLSWADIIRQIGVTLQRPVGTLAQESQIIHYHKQGEGCPPPEDSQWLAMITGIIDPVLTMVLSMLPGSMPLVVLQSVLGPVLELLADGLSGAKLDADKINKMEDLGQQAYFMAKGMISTLSQSEFAALYNKKLTKPVPVPKGSRPADRFSAHNQGLYVKIDGQDYLYRAYREGTPYVVADEQARIIRFNQKEKRWEFVDRQDSLVHTKANRKDRQLPGITLTQLFKNHKTEISLDSSDERFLRISHADGGDFSGVSLDDAIVPIEKYEVNGETVMTASFRKHQENRVLLHTNYGWVFEQASVDMDKYLEFLLNSKDIGVSYTPEKKFSPIKPDGFSYDEHGEAFIKKNDKYYPVYKFMAGHAVVGHTPSLFTRENGIFKLQVARDMLFGFKTVSIGYPLLEPEFSVVRLETEGRDYLLEHGLKYDTTLKSRVGPSLYIDNKARLVFSDGSNHFAVSNDRGSQIDLKSKEDSYKQGNIQLWLDEDFYLRIRDESEKEPHSYSEIGSCRNKRAPGQGESCLPISIEKSLDALLTHNIDLGRTSNKNIRDLNLAEVKLFDTQFLFYSSGTGKYYFLYKGRYFNAELINVHDSRNVTGKILIQLYCKCTFYSCKYPITSIIFEKINNRIEIKQQKTFLAEKLNIHEEIADNYLRSRLYRRTSGMDVVEGSVEQVLYSDIYIDEIYEIYEQEIPDTILNKIVCRKLFPSRVVENSDFSIKIFGLNDNPDTLLPYMREAQKNIKKKFEYINKFLFPSAAQELTFMRDQFLEGDIEEYFNTILGSERLKFPSNRLKFIYKFSSALKKRLKIIADTLKISNIHLVTAVKNGDEPLNNLESILTENEQNQEDVAFITPDKNKKIFINIDKTYIPFSRPKGTADVDSVLIREASLAGGMATDIVHIPSGQDGQYIPIQEAIDDMIDKIRALKVLDINNFNQLSIRYLKNISVYRDRINEMMVEQKLAYLAKNDPGYLAHLILNSSDFLALLMIDLHNINVYGVSTTKIESIIAYRQPKNILATGSIGTVYDLHNDYVMKDYRGIITAERRSRFDSAAKNVEGMTRMYGTGSATALMHVEKEGTSSISVKMIKVPGLPVSSILRISDQAQLEIYRTAIKKFTSQAIHPAVELAEKLRIKGVNHHDINEANLLFDIDKGFNLIDFDSADIRPQGEPLSNEIAADKARQLKQIIDKLNRFIDLPSNPG